MQMAGGSTVSLQPHLLSVQNHVVLILSGFSTGRQERYVMQSAKVNHLAANPAAKQIFIFVSITIVLILVGTYVINASRSSQTDRLPPGTIPISHMTLEEKYGLRVNLVAVTGAGGFVDVRLKILNGEKARSLLQDPNHFPSLVVDDDGTILSVSQETREQEFHFEDNSNLFIMFPNTGNAVKPGARLRILFGDVTLEPTDVQ